MSKESAARGVPRHPGDLIRVVLGTATFVGSVVLVQRGDVGTLETDVFRLVNHLTDALSAPLMVVMQAGSFGAVVVAAGLAVATRRRQLARDLAAGGTLAYLLARLAKLAVARGRPLVLLDAVILRGGAGLRARFSLRSCCRRQRSCHSGWAVSEPAGPPRDLGYRLAGWLEQGLHRCAPPIGCGGWRSTRLGRGCSAAPAVGCARGTAVARGCRASTARRRTRSCGGADCRG